MLFYSFLTAILTVATTLSSCVVDRRHDPCRIDSIHAGFHIDRSSWTNVHILTSSGEACTVSSPPDSIRAGWKSIPTNETRESSNQVDAIGQWADHFGMRRLYEREFATFCQGLVGRSKECVVTLLGEPERQYALERDESEAIEYRTDPPHSLGDSTAEVASVTLSVCRCTVVSVSISVW